MWTPLQFFSFKNAIETFVQGFLSHPKNNELRKALRYKTLSIQEFYQQCLCCVYRFLFLFIADEIQHFSPKNLLLKKKEWGDWISFFQKLSESSEFPFRESFLFAPTTVSWLESSQLKNTDLAQTFSLIFSNFSSELRADYGIIPGRSYEFLLGYSPEWESSQKKFSLVPKGGHSQKTSGSYYTSETLIQCLLDSVFQSISADTVLKTSGLKICDPACGPGFFLIATARYLTQQFYSKKSKSVSNEKKAIFYRNILKNSLYGVDINPLIVEICKFHLWSETREPTLPLSFFDSRIQCGNSLIGATPELIRKTLAVEPFLTQADFSKVMASRFLADAWCAFLMEDPKTHPEHFRRLVRDTLKKTESPSTAGGKKNLKKIQHYRNTYHFFHWHLAFPEVFHSFHATKKSFSSELNSQSGFDIVLGNPPWERIKIQEKEWFSQTCAEVAKSASGAERHQRIEDLKKANRPLYLAFKNAKKATAQLYSFLKNSHRYPFCARGDINTYAVFIELQCSLLNSNGRTGIIVPAGILTDRTTQDFFRDLIQSQKLIRLFHFNNQAGHFSKVGKMIHFCLMTLTRGTEADFKGTECCFFIQHPEDLKNPDRLILLNATDFALMNPNTRTGVLIRNQLEMKLLRALYQRVPVFFQEQGSNAWNFRLCNLFHMTNDSHFFILADRFRKKRPASKTSLLPLYEAKMFHHFHHRLASYSLKDKKIHSPLTLDILKNPEFRMLPRYFVPEALVQKRLSNRWTQKWFLGVRSICRSSDERTVIASILPFSGVGNSTTLILLAQNEENIAVSASLLLANLSSMVVDFIARLKMSGPNLNFFLLKQLPILPYACYQHPCTWDPSKSLLEWVQLRVLQLSYHAVDLQSFAQDSGYTGEPFPFEEKQRFQLRCELDAAYFICYGLTLSEVQYVLNQFPLLKKREEKQYGFFRTEQKILELYQQFQKP